MDPPNFEAVVRGWKKGTYSKIWITAVVWVACCPILGDGNADRYMKVTEGRTDLERGFITYTTSRGKLSNIFLFDRKKAQKTGRVPCAPSIKQWRKAKALYVNTRLLIITSEHVGGMLLLRRYHSTAALGTGQYKTPVEGCFDVTPDQGKQEKCYRLWINWKSTRRYYQPPNHVCCHRRRRRRRHRRRLYPNRRCLRCSKSELVIQFIEKCAPARRRESAIAKAEVVSKQSANCAAVLEAEEVVLRDAFDRFCLV